ncbi:MFS transporter [Bacillus sp. 1P06AnD]|uniref:MFS transporter n=1 Tax=Bacillus sp. 1P06AnD TaxID=3132208 RepID=UPI0039A1EDFC
MPNGCRALAAFESVLSLYVDYKFGFTPKDIAIIITGSAAIGVFGQLFLFERVANRFGEIAIIRYSLMMSAAFVFFMTVAHSYFTVMVISFLLFFGFDTSRPAINAYFFKVASDQQGFAGGMNSMFTSLGNIFGPIAGGVLFDVDIHYPYYLAAIILSAGIIIALF